MARQKFTKTKLKSLVKECLLEILYEGAGAKTPDLNSLSNINESRGNATQVSSKIARSHPGLDSIASSVTKVENPNFSKNIENVTRQMTDDPVLSSLLADTAKTTLQEQVESPGPGGMSVPGPAAGDHAARVVNASTPDQLFGESSSKWASLAFSDLPAKK